MGADASQWLDAQPASLARHVGVLRQLVEEARRDERVRIVVVGCSIGRGVADELSDIDAYIAVRPEDWPAYAADADAMLGRLDDLLDSSRKRVTPEGKDPYDLTWALYRNGVPMELVIAPAPEQVRRKSDWVVLYDPDRRVGEVQPPRVATTEDVRGWAYDGWSTLLLCAKYFKRRSFWEALETLHLVRTRVWRLSAASRGIADPQFGLTAVFDSDDPSPPPGIERTVASLEFSSIRSAAIACSEMLDDLWFQCFAVLGSEREPLPPAAAAARRALEELD